MGSEGVLDGGARVVLPTEAETVIPSLLAPDHGAAVAPVGRPASIPAVAHGALVPTPGVGRAVAVDDEPASGATGRA